MVTMLEESAYAGIILCHDSNSNPLALALKCSWHEISGKLTVENKDRQVSYICALIS